MLASTNTLFLVRHATPKVQKGICYGRLDLETIADDAQALHEKLTTILPRDIDLHTSPLQRCASTAHALAASGWPVPTIDERLAEMHFGDWEGKPWNDIERAQIDAWAANIVDYRPPSGESVRDVAARALACIAQLSFAKDTALITHAGVIQVLNKLLLKMPLENFSASKIEYGAIISLQRTVEPDGSITFTAT
jgi:alpha-ribazole phosphatase